MYKKTISRLVLLALLYIGAHSLSIAQDQKTIVFFGNSLSAGLGVSPEESFPGVIRKKLEREGYNYKVINAGLSGETSAGGLSRIDWFLKNNEMDIFVLELGANDGLRGLNTEQTKKNLAEIIEKVRAKDPKTKILIAGMQVPPNLGNEYLDRFGKIFGELAKEYHAELVPFLLEGVGGIKRLNQTDGIHPNAEGHRIMAQNVWEKLKLML